MMKEKQKPNWMLWLRAHFPIVLLASVGAGAIAIVAVVYINDRLSGAADKINSAPPQRYQPPNLDDYDAGAMTTEKLIDHRVVYVPVYSHVYYQGGAAFSLETMLSIRNVDTTKPIYIESVQYINTKGKVTKTQVDRLVKLMPLQTIEFLVAQRDSSGGSGANFLVRWGSNSKVNRPLIESVMIGTAGTQGISFARTGIELAGVESAGD